MNNYFQNMQKIESGLSKKKIFRKIDKNLNKIFIDFSNDKNEFFNFLKVYQILNKVNVSIPKIYEVNINKKLIVMEDFGDNRFDKIYKERDFFHLLKIAVDNLIVIHNSLNSDDLCQLKQYSYSDFKNEISEFVDYFIPYKMIPDFPKNEFYNCWEHIYNIQKFNFTSFVHKDYEFITGRPDGISDSECIIEIKCPNKKRNKLTPDAIPRQYFYQCQVYMEIMNREICHYVEYYINEKTQQRDFQYCSIIRDRQWFKTIMPIIQKFYDEVKKYCDLGNSLDTHPIRMAEHSWNHFIKN